MRPYVRPLIVTFSALALASLFSYLAILLTDTPAKQPIDSMTDGLSVEAKAILVFVEAKAAAAGGDPEKLMALANFYLLGIGTDKNEVEAARLHRRAAEQGHAPCQYFFGCDLTLGIGVKKDVAAGLAWIRKSAAQENAEAEYHLYKAHRGGDGVDKDEAVARAWLLKAAEHGQSDARVELAEEILIGKDEGRYKAVATWVRPGAMMGHAKSCYVMAFIYGAGIGVKKDPVESVAWYLVMLNADEGADADSYRQPYDALSADDQAAAEKRAKELCDKRAYKSAFAPDSAELEAARQAFTEAKLKAESGDLDAQYELSRRLEDGEGTKVDLEDAVRWARRAAEKGHAESQYRLGVYLAKGEGVMPDPKEAYSWFRKSAAQGDPYAERAVALSLLEGNGVKADPIEAKQWLLRAAEHDQPQAQWEVGCDFYGNNPDIARDAIAARWFRKSAEQLDPRALISLGICYRLGRGVPKDPIEGLAWIALGSEQYDSEQKRYVGKLIEDCTDEELKEVNERAKVLKKECRDKFMAKLEAKKK
jgi:TPR repeat protein